MTYKKSFIYILMIALLICITGCGVEKAGDITTNNINQEKITVAVSIVPEESFVKAVAGDLVDIVTMIPPGNSPANYQPTPKEMTAFSEAKIYFSIGVPTEKANILPKIDDFNKDIEVVSLADKVGGIYHPRYFDEGEEHHHEENEETHNQNSEIDPHIWLSPKRVKIMIETIKDELVLLDPNNKSTYERNADEYIAKLDEVDKEIKETLSGFDNQAFIIYHPSFGYFADDYGLEMVTIEEEGKEATSKKLQEVIDFAKNENIKFVFYQEEFDNNQAETIAKEINGATVKVAPLAPNYIENLMYIANKFKEVLK